MLFRISILPHLQIPRARIGRCPCVDHRQPDWRVVRGQVHSGPLGYRSRSGTGCSFQWKVGIYANNEDAITIDYDNVGYGKKWNNVTKNRLIGYQKSVLRLSFDEGQGITVNDRSWTWNGGQAGDPVSDYNNDGKIVGTARWNLEACGKSLRFDAQTTSRCQST